MRIILTILLSIITTIAAASCLMPTFQANYDLIHNNSVIGALTSITTQHKNTYKKSTNANIKVFLFHKKSSMNSSGTFSSAGFSPNYFVYQDGSNNKTQRLHHGEQDALSYSMQLQHLLLKGSKHMTIKVFMNKKMQNINFYVHGKQHLTIENKKMQAVLVSGSMPNKVALKLWFAPALDYTLVKSVTLHDNKVALTAELSSYKKTSGCFYIK